MGYGRGEYGQAGFGGSSFEEGGPVLVSSDPLNGASGVAPTASITFHLQSPAGLDEFSLNVNVNGQQAIVGGVFRPSFSGTIVQNPETDMVITIPSHPAIPGGPASVAIFVKDLAGNSASLNFTFSVITSVIVAESLSFSDAVTTALAAGPIVTETVGFIENLGPAQGFGVSVQENISFLEHVETGALQVEALDGSTLRVSFPVELRFDRIRDLGNYSITKSSHLAAGVLILQVMPTYDVFQTGSDIFALPQEYAFPAGPDAPSRGNLVDGTTNVLDFWFTGTFTPDDIGSYIEIENGMCVGLYQILDVEDANIGPAPRRQRVYIDGLLPLGDMQNGYVEGFLEIVSAIAFPPGSTMSFRMTHPSVTPTDALVEVLTIYNRDAQVGVGFDEILSGSAAITLNDYNTFTLTDSTFVGATSGGDRIVVLARVTPKLQWRQLSGVKALVFSTTKLTIDEDYTFAAHNLLTRETGDTLDISAGFKVTPPAGHEQQPKVIGVEYQATDGTVFVEFDQTMRVDDDNLGNSEDYTITGPTPVQVKRVLNHTPSIVALLTAGIETGDYTLTVSTSTPKDVAGNPIDPAFTSVIFTSSTPEAVRSVFTDRGPIAKPPLTLQTGTGASLQTHRNVTLPGSSLTANNIGNYVRLSGGSLNGGTFRIAAVLAATRARLANASFTLPDPDSGSLDWELFDPRYGQIADDPADVTVRINGLPVTPEAVVGLLGQVLLTTAPDPTDDVKIDYSWVCNPTVEVRRLNSREFRLNSWNRDIGYPLDKSQHKYRYNNVLIRPGDYDPEIPSAVLDQPLLRDLHYRAYERAYTPVLNDPSLLLLNSPIHRIAYPPAQRTLSEDFVAYEGIGLPESLITDPWVRKGSGTATSSGGHLTVTDTSTGPYPSGKPLFWTRPIDLTFPNVFAISWRFSLDTTTPDGIFTGVAAGYSDAKVVLVVGYILDGSTKKIGILKRGFGDDPSSLTGWTGGVDVTDNPTGLPAEIDWDALHSYRVFQDRNGTIKVFIDGDLIELLRVTPDELPFLEELSGPFNEIQGTFFGSLSRPAQNSSTWDFVRYLVQPTNPVQTAASSFVSYEANVVPEQDAKPWTPVGFHGTETIQSSDFLLLDSTSATDATTASAVGLVGGDYKGFVRFEPLLTESSEIVLDAQVQLLTFTHGISPNALTFAVDDGSRLMQVSFITDLTGPAGLIARISYGGRSFPPSFAPFNWQTAGTAPVAMAGRILHIRDNSTTDGRVYFHDDPAPITDVTRVVSYLLDYMVEFRCRVESFTVDAGGYAGAFAQAYDSARSVGLLFEVLSGIRYVSFHSDGTTLGPSAQFAFNWGDGSYHTYRMVKSTTGSLVTLFIDGTFVGSLAYSSFLAPAPDSVGQLSFGSSTPGSSGSLSVVDWVYVNAWRIRTDFKPYVGIWRGKNSGTLLDYHLPLKASGNGATVAGNALGDGNGDFIAQGVVPGDHLIVAAGPNQGVYTIAAVGSPTALTIQGVWPAQPSVLDYTIAKETDWSILHKYRLHRSDTGEVALLLDTDPDPLILVGYNSIDLPVSGVGIIKTLADGLPTVAFGSFDPTNLEQSKWDFVRYGLTKSVTDLRLAPHHQVLNQWNVMESPERLFTTLPHTLTDFKSSSTGNVPKEDPDFLADPALTAFTQLNEDTPLVPRTQTFEVRAPFPVQEFVSALNRPEDVLNNSGDFTMNDATQRFRLIVPNDVLYTSLDVIRHTTGETDLLAPFDDDDPPTFSKFTYTKEVCLKYEGDVLPENDATAPTPWQLVSDAPGEVNVSSFAGILTYGTSPTGTNTVYRNNTPLPDHPSLINEVKFRLKLVSDTSLGTGATEVKFGFSAPGMTAALTFVTSPLGERFVQILDLNNNNVLGSASFDFLDGNFHTYRIVRDPGHAVVQVFIDS